MKLLDKKKISSDFNTQRKMQIDEGVQIAKKVDVLRETLVSLEAQHKSFIAGSRQELINATDTLQNKKATLEGEIRKLEEKRVLLMKPLDDEWAKVVEDKEELAKSWNEFKTLEDDLYERESTIKKTEEAIEKTRQKLSFLETDAEQETRDTKEDRAKAKVIRKEAEDFRDTTTRSLETDSKRISDREKEINAWAKTMELHQKTLDEKEKILNDIDRAINDKYETLMRTINRLK